MSRDSAICSDSISNGAATQSVSPATGSPLSRHSPPDLRRAATGVAAFFVGDRADSLPVRPPSLPRVLAAAGRDLYEQAARLIPANLLWGIAAFAWASLLLVLPPLVVVVAAPLLVLPLVAVFRLATCIARGRQVALSDALWAIPTYAAPALLLGTGVSLAVLAFGIWVVIGIGLGGFVGGGIATLGGWGVVGTGLVAVTFLPLIVDPVREPQSLRTKLRVVGLVILASPGRSAAFGIAVAVILVVSTLAFPALLSMSLAYCACVAARSVLPIADRLDTRPEEGSHPEGQ